MKNLKISICTVCMNRLHHIKETLPVNIKNNSNYGNIEFVLLDYGSSDGLFDWVKQHMQEHLESGLLKYYYTSIPKHFDRSHSRNLMFRLAEGEIICNVDADNYAGENFAQYVNDVFNDNDDIYLVVDTKKRYYFLRNAFGRFCVRKSDFELLGGLDEKMVSYGSETLDFYERLALLGKSEYVIEDISFLDAISHGDEERISNEFFITNLKNLYISHRSIHESCLLVVYQDQTFEYCEIVPEKVITHLPAALKDKSLVKGSFVQEGNKYVFQNIDHAFIISEDQQTGYFDNKPEQVFYNVSDAKFIHEVAKNYSFITNTEQLNANKVNDTYQANEGRYGKGKVLKNFLENIELV